MLPVLLVLIAGITIGAVAVAFSAVPLPAIGLPPFENTLAFFKQLIAAGVGLLVFIAVVLSG